MAVGLTKETIVRAALAEIDRNGVEAFSLRALGRALGVNATAIVWHVRNRDVLLAEVVALLQRDVAPPRAAGQAWTDWLRTLFRRQRAVMQRHPEVAPLIGAAIVSNARPDLDFVEALVAVLQEAGFEGERLRDAYNAVQAALVGFPTQEFARMPSDDRPGWREEMRGRLLSVDPDRHPTLARNLPLFENRAFILRWQNGVEAPMEDGFAAYVECFVAGLEAMRGA